MTLGNYTALFIGLISLIAIVVFILRCSNGLGRLDNSYQQLLKKHSENVGYVRTLEKKIAEQKYEIDCLKKRNDWRRNGL